jgi:xanthine dehydrogenase accessory factor
VCQGVETIALNKIHVLTSEKIEMTSLTKTAVVKGGGDLGTAVAIRLAQAGMRVVVTELANPLVVRREVALASAVFKETVCIEGATTGRKVADFNGVQTAWSNGEIPVLVDPTNQISSLIHPDVLVDAIIAKRNTGTTLLDAPVVIALGPGFRAGVDCHALIETMRGPDLGRPVYSGEVKPDTGVPGVIGGETYRRVLRVPVDGIFAPCVAIGDLVQAGQTVAEVNGLTIKTEIDGVIRGLLAEGLFVHQGEKAGDVDPRGKRELCYLVSDKAWKIADGVLEAVHTLESTLK